MKIRSKKHLRFIASQPCMICGVWDETVVPHHLLRSGGKGMGTKACDGETVPMCHYHHQQLHLNGDEIHFFNLYGLDYESVLDTARYYCIESPCKKIKEAEILK